MYILGMEIKQDRNLGSLVEKEDLEVVMLTGMKRKIFSKRMNN